MREDEKSLSPALASALKAVARMKGDAEPDALLWAEFLGKTGDAQPDNVDPRQRSKPVGR